jgi:hypothetical protein
MGYSYANTHLALAGLLRFFKIAILSGLSRGLTDEKPGQPFQ